MPTSPRSKDTYRAARKNAGIYQGVKPTFRLNYPELYQDQSERGEKHWMSTRRTKSVDRETL